MIESKFMSPIQGQFTCESRLDLVDAYRKIAAVASHGQSSERGYWSQSGVWLVEHSKTSESAIVELERRGVLRGSVAHSKSVLTTNEKGGCEIVCSGWVPPRVWLGTLAAFGLFWLLRFEEKGWTDWMAKETVVLVVVYSFFAYCWHLNLKKLITEQRNALGI